MPFPRNGEFVGRDGDLTRLHASLSEPGSGPVGIRPAGLTGMGGIGKTQLVVEYVYRHRDDYPEGIFWIDAAGPLVEAFRPACDGSSFEMGRERAASRRADTGSVQGTKRQAACALGAR